VVWAVFFPVPLGMLAWTRSGPARPIALLAWITWSARPVVVATVSPAPVVTRRIEVASPSTSVTRFAPPAVPSTTSAIAPTTVPASPPATAPPTVAPPATAPSTAAPATTTSPPSTGSALTLVGALRIAPEGPRAGYSRDQFGGGWIDADHNHCDTRCEVLAQERIAVLPGLPGGGWVSLYDGYTTNDPHELQIDHMVPLAEAWDSGASTWSPARRLAFANDLDLPGALNAVTASSNTSKGDRDPAQWQPPNRGAWCAYVADWISVKVKWGLSADRAEVVALLNMGRGC
jgi:hypothetical protein